MRGYGRFAAGSKSGGKADDLSSPAIAHQRQQVLDLNDRGGKKNEMREEFIPPVSFELILKHKHKEALREVVKWLLSKDSNMAQPFQWEMVMLESTTKYQLSIQSSWAFNLKGIAKILMKYREKK